MTMDPTLTKTLSMALVGTEAHVKTADALTGLRFESAGEVVNGAHSICQILNHMDYWQGLAVEWLEGGEPTWPEHAEDGWPGSERPGNQEEWDGLVERFKTNLETVLHHVEREDLFEARGKWTPVRVLRWAASHNSYHIGQIVMLRRMLGSWPPPGGGDTW